MNTHHTRFADGARVGLTRHELGRYSLARLAVAAAGEDRGELTFYRDHSDAVARRIGAPPSTFNSFYLPADYVDPVQTRDLTSGNAAGGGYLVAGYEVAFADGLYGATPLGRLPMRTSGATGDTGIAVTGSAASQWLSTEATQTNTADPTFGIRSGVPKTVSTVSNMSRHLVLQTGPAGVRYVERQLGKKVGDTVATALFNGSGASGEPLGLLNVSGTTSTSGSSLGWSGIRDLLAAAEGYEAGDLVFVMGVNAAKLLRSREKATGSGFVLADGRIDGYPVLVTRCMPTDALLVAPWSLVNMTTWGALEVTITPFSSPGAFQSGKIGMRIMWSLDFTVDHPAVVGKATSIT